MDKLLKADGATGTRPAMKGLLHSPSLNAKGEPNDCTLFWILNTVNPKVISETGESYESKAETKLYKFQPTNIWNKKLYFPKDYYHSQGLNTGP